VEFSPARRRHRRNHLSLELDVPLFFLAVDLSADESYGLFDGLSASRASLARRVERVAWLQQIARLSRPRRKVASWGGAIAIFLIFLGIRFALEPSLAGLRFITFYPAIAISTLLFGFLPGLMVLTLSALSAWYFFMEPLNSFGLKENETIPHLIAFICVGGFMWALVGALREAVHRFEVAKTGQEMLFQELQHRVANNLQLVVSLLRTAHRNLQNPIRAAESLEEAEARIMAMSRLHRHLNDGAAFKNGL
jgi:two-component sensor histidine kinase